MREFDAIIIGAGQAGPSLAGRLTGAGMTVAFVERKLGVKPGQTTPDGVFTLSTAECLGSCGTAPVVMVNDTYHENMSIEKLDRLLDELKGT